MHTNIPIFIYITANYIIHNKNNNDDKSGDTMNADSVTFSVVDEVSVHNCIVNRDTILDDTDTTATQLQHGPYEVDTHSERTFVPGEGQVTLSIFTDEDAE